MAVQLKYMQGVDDKPIWTRTRPRPRKQSRIIQQWVSEMDLKDAERTKDIVDAIIMFTFTVERKFTHPNDYLIQMRITFMLHFPYQCGHNQADAVWRNLQENNTMLATQLAPQDSGNCLSAWSFAALAFARNHVVCPDNDRQWSSEFRAHIQMPNSYCRWHNWNNQPRPLSIELPPVIGCK